MKISLKTAVITGSSRGLGRAIAVKLAQEAVHYLTRGTKAEKTLALLGDSGAQGVFTHG